MWNVLVALSRLGLFWNEVQNRSIRPFILWVLHEELSLLG